MCAAVAGRSVDKRKTYVNENVNVVRFIRIGFCDLIIPLSRYVKLKLSPAPQPHWGVNINGNEIGILK